MALSQLQLNVLRTVAIDDGSVPVAFLVTCQQEETGARRNGGPRKPLAVATTPMATRSGCR